MKTTDLIYMTNDSYNAIGCKVIETGNDEIGKFAIFDKSIGYPGGGGQEKDNIILIDHKGTDSSVTKVNFNKGYIKYYYTSEKLDTSIDSKITMIISRNTREINSAFHTVGHWISSVVVENLMLNLFPTKGFHFKEGAYVEFTGDDNISLEELKYAIEYSLKIDKQANYKIKSFFVDSLDIMKLPILLPKNFKPMSDRPFRIVQMENYKGIPCGGTHIDSLKILKRVSIKKIKRKNGKIRVSYDLDIHPIIAVN
jgi:Ser-tRNA(Ala) deacylase AlaX